jgi:hypothetical protein
MAGILEEERRIYTLTLDPAVAASKDASLAPREIATAK